MRFLVALGYILNFIRGNSWCFSKFTTMTSVLHPEQILGHSSTLWGLDCHDISGFPCWASCPGKCSPHPACPLGWESSTDLPVALAGAANLISHCSGHKDGLEAQQSQLTGLFRICLVGNKRGMSCGKQVAYPKLILPFFLMNKILFLFSFSFFWVGMFPVENIHLLTLSWSQRWPCSPFANSVM